MDKYDYLTIPVLVMLNKNLSSTDKILYGILLLLSKKYGYCFASNKYLTDILDINFRALQYSLKNLKDSDLIEIEIMNGNDRKIIPLGTKNLISYEEKQKMKNPDIFNYDWLNDK